MYKYKNKAI